ncbi:MAG: hypothetical protein ACRDXB_02080, partial [Actinomycetes bacterium]
IDGHRPRRDRRPTPTPSGAPVPASRKTPAPGPMVYPPSAGASERVDARVQDQASSAVGGDERARLASRWRGLNMLGFALMAARARLGARTGPGAFAWD